MSFLEKNLRALSARDLKTAEWIKKAKTPAGLSITRSKSGLPAPKLNNVSLHSSYYPEKEDEKLLSDYSIGPSDALVIFGFGFGYHIGAAAAKASSVIVVEPSPGMLKAAFTQMDLTKIIDRVSIVSPDLFAGMAPALDYARVRWIDHEPSVRLYSKQRDILAEPFLIRSLNASRKYKVLVVGPTSGGSVPAAFSSARALGELGFEVDFMDMTGHRQEILNIANNTPNLQDRAALKEIFNNYLGEKVAARANHIRPDIILALAQAPLTPPLIERLKQIDAPIVFWFVENYRALPYWKSVAPHYDYFFAIQKGKFLEELSGAGAAYAGYLPQAADPSAHRPISLSADDKTKYGAKISFMGAGYPNRRQFFAGLLDTDLKIWGTEWDMGSQLGLRVQNKNKRLASEEYIKIFNASLINLNLHSSLTATAFDPMGDFINPRTFEIAACGAFGLVDERDELSEMFEMGKEMVSFNSMDDLREKIDYYVKFPGKRKAIAKAGMERVLKEHTFTHRMAKMMSVVLLREEKRIDNARSKSRGVNDVDSMIKRAKDPETKKFLKRFSGQGNLKLGKVMDDIAKGNGPLTRPEAMFVMINQILSQDA